MAKIATDALAKFKLSESIQKMYIEYRYQQNGANLVIRFGFGSSTNPHIEDAAMWEMDAMQDPNIAHIHKTFSMFQDIKNTLT